MPKELRKLKIINFNRVCRSCLSERGHLREINSTKIPKMMENCASVQVQEDDGLPSKICVTCFHLIAKFFSFKKKMERSDRILRNYIKQSKIKQSDIINIALSKAEIKDDNSDTSASSVHLKDDMFDFEDRISDEDIPLSQRIIREYSLNKNQEKAVKPLDEDEKIEEILNIGNDSNMVMSSVAAQIFSDGPPPLVPLEPLKRVDNLDTSIKLPKDTPPLIPITPIVIKTVPIDLKLQCNSCGEDFNTVAALKEHKLNTCQSNALQCNICRKEFKERKKLIGHLKGHMVVKDYCCKICDKRYPNPSTFKVHMRTHTGERPFKCQICSKGFVRWAGVVGHMHTHQPQKPFKCETCGKCFKISSNLERHKVLHSGSLPYCCNYCGKTFSQSDNLQLHIRTYHTNERPYLCNECGKGFVSSTRLKRHMFVHTGYKPYCCQTCSKAYSNSNDLKNHQRSHSSQKSDDDKLYACTSCSMRFYHPCRLARHMKTHEKPYVCNICFKTFSSETLLNKHISNKHSIDFLDEVLQEEEIFVKYD